MSSFKALPGRIAIAIPGIGIFFAVAFLNIKILTVFSTSLIAFLIAFEGIALFNVMADKLQRSVGALFTALATVAVALLPAKMSMPILLFPGISLFLINIAQNNPEKSRRRSLGTKSLLIITAMSLGLLARLRLDYESPWVFFLPLLICWGGDTFAYTIGKTLGKHKLFPVISPNKTWEGFFAGLLGAGIGAVLAGSVGAGYPVYLMVLLGIAGGAAGVVGDLMESAMKRDAGVKDSGSILAGHGGLFDRFDSLLISVPVIWLLLILIERSGIQ